MATKNKGGFLAAFVKELNDMDGIGTSSKPPRYWYSTGNYVLNKIISGSFYKGIPQGRVTDLAGPSGSGKSFVGANILRAAQAAGAICLVVDSENALDDDYMTKIGVKVGAENNYYYAGVKTIADVTRVVSTFIRGYKEEFGTSDDAPQVFILIDSLDMLTTETELENYEKGIQKGDQGQRNKQLKHMLRTFVQDIKDLNIAMVCVSQVYKNQDVTNGEGVWIVADAVKYACSQIVMLTKLKLKDKNIGEVTGIRMKAEGYKTRFTQPFQTVVVEVPYSQGMDPFSGLVEVALELGSIQKRGSRYVITGSEDTWFAKDIAEHAVDILAACENVGGDVRLIGEVDASEIDPNQDVPEA
jgi:recombination protein RecA